MEDIDPNSPSLLPSIYPSFRSVVFEWLDSLVGTPQLKTLTYRDVMDHFHDTRKGVIKDYLSQWRKKNQTRLQAQHQNAILSSMSEQMKQATIKEALDVAEKGKNMTLQYIKGFLFDRIQDTTLNPVETRILANLSLKAIEIEAKYKREEEDAEDAKAFQKTLENLIKDSAGFTHP
jgi:hypothetical protein